MDKYDYVITKPEMEEVLYHAGFHKYIDKYLGKNGKWIYKYAGQAKSAATGAINKAKTMLPGLQKQATGAVSTARKAVSTAASSGARTASSVKKQAQKRINAMLPILSKKFNSAKKKARSQAAGVKLVARDKTKKLKKQADGTYSNVKKAVTKKTKALKGAYYSGKSKGAEAAAKYKREKKMKIGSYSIATNGNRIGVNNDVRIFGAHNISSQSGRVGSRVNEGISAGRKRVAKKRKNKK